MFGAMCVAWWPCLASGTQNGPGLLGSSRSHVRFVAGRPTKSSGSPMFENRRSHHQLAVRTRAARKTAEWNQGVSRRKVVEHQFETGVVGLGRTAQLNPFHVSLASAGVATGLLPSRRRGVELVPSAQTVVTETKSLCRQPRHSEQWGARGPSLFASGGLELVSR
jgi:hypothetical protein